MATDANYFGREIFMLRVTGLSLIGNEGLLYKIYSYLTVALMDFAHPTLQMFDAFKYTFVESSIILYRNFASYQGLLKASIVLSNRRKLKGIIDKLDNMMLTVRLNPKVPSEVKLVQECISVANKQSLVYWSLMLGSIVGTVIRCVIKFSLSDDPSDWEFPYVYQTISISDIAIHYLGLDLITATSLLHLSYHFRILGCRIVALAERGNLSAFQGENRVKDTSTEDIFEFDENNWNTLNNNLKEAVNYHTLIIKTAQEMEGVFSNLLLLIMINVLLILCFLTYFLSVVQLDYLQQIQYFSHFLIVSSQMFLLCFWGEQLSAESENVALAITEMDFVGCDLRFQKCLTLILARSQRGVRFSAGHVAPLGLSTFTWIMRNSYSAFVMLRNVNRH